MPLNDMCDGELSTDQLNVLNDKPIAVDPDQDSLDDDVGRDLAWMNKKQGSFLFRQSKN